MGPVGTVLSKTGSLYIQETIKNTGLYQCINQNIPLSGRVNMKVVVLCRSLMQVKVVAGHDIL